MHIDSALQDNHICTWICFGGRRYCMGPTGTGACYIARDKLETLLPSWVGCHGEVVGTDDSLERFELLPSARRFEFGSRNVSVLPKQDLLALCWASSTAERQGGEKTDTELGQQRSRKEKGCVQS